MAILVIAEHDNAELKAATLNAVTAAAQIGGDVEMLVAGNGCGAAAEAAAKVIIKGIRSKKARILIGKDARFIDKMVRWFPAAYTKWVFNWGKRKGLGDKNT